MIQCVLKGLLAGKKACDYREFYEALRHEFKKHNPECDEIVVVTDMEISLHSEFKKAFWDFTVTRKTCTVHYNRAMDRYLHKHKLAEHNNTDSGQQRSEFQQNVRLCKMLPNMPGSLAVPLLQHMKAECTNPGHVNQSFSTYRLYVKAFDR